MCVMYVLEYVIELYVHDEALYGREPIVVYSVESAVAKPATRQLSTFPFHLVILSALFAFDMQGMQGVDSVCLRRSKAPCVTLGLCNLTPSPPLIYPCKLVSCCNG